MLLSISSIAGVALDVIIVAVLVIFGLIGLKKGFFKSVLSMISTLVVIILSIVFASYLARLINKIYDFTGLIAGKLSKGIAGMGAFYSDAIPAGMSGADLANNIPSTTNRFLKKLMAYVLKPLSASDIEGATVAEIVSGAFASIIMLIISAILLFILIKVIIAITSRLFENITRNRVFGATNKLLGFAFGAAKGLIVIIIFSIVLTFLTVVPFINTKISPIIQDNTAVAKPIYNTTDKFIEKHVIDGKIVQKWIDNLWENKYKDNGKDKPTTPSTPDPGDTPTPDGDENGTIENPIAITLTAGGGEAEFVSELNIDFSSNEVQYYSLDPSTNLVASFSMVIDVTGADYEVYNTIDKDIVITDLTSLGDTQDYIIKFVKSGSGNTVTANLTLTQNKT